MLSARSNKLESVLSNILQVMILVAGLITISFFGIVFIMFDVWNEYSIPTLAFGVLAVFIPIFSFVKNNERRNKKLEDELRNRELDNERRDRELNNERRDKKLEWKKFQVREIILIKTAELKSLTDPWHSSEVSKDLHVNLYDPEIRDLDQRVKGLIRELKDMIDFSIDLGDLGTAKESSSNIRLALQDTPWLKDWVSVSFAHSVDRWDND